MLAPLVHSTSRPVSHDQGLINTIHFPPEATDLPTVPSPPRFSPSVFTAHRVQQSHRSPIFHRVLLTHALAISASQFVHKKKCLRTYTSMHSGGLELTKPTYTRLEDNLIRHRGDRLYIISCVVLSLPTEREVVRACCRLICSHHARLCAVKFCAAGSLCTRTTYQSRVRTRYRNCNIMPYAEERSLGNPSST